MEQPPCPRCAPLPASLTVATGRDETFPPAFLALRTLYSDREVDVRECPACGSLFRWESHPQYFGTGSHDEESLDRIPAEHAAVLRFFHKVPPVDDPHLPAMIDRLFEGLPGFEAALVLDHLLFRVEDGVFRLCLPRLVERFVAIDGSDDGDRIANWVSHSTDRAVVVLSLLAPHMDTCRGHFFRLLVERLEKRAQPNPTEEGK